MPRTTASLNGRVRYTSPMAKWALTFFVNNLTDEVYGNNAQPLRGRVLGCGGAGRDRVHRRARALSVTRGRPREYGMTFQYNFGGDGAGSR